MSTPTPHLVYPKQDNSVGTLSITGHKTPLLTPSRGRHSHPQPQEPAIKANSKLSKLALSTPPYYQLNNGQPSAITKATIKTTPVQTLDFLSTPPMNMTRSPPPLWGEEVSSYLFPIELIQVTNNKPLALCKPQPLSTSS